MRPAREDRGCVRLFVLVEDTDAPRVDRASVDEWVGVGRGSGPINGIVGEGITSWLVAARSSRNSRQRSVDVDVDRVRESAREQVDLRR